MVALRNQPVSRSGDRQEPELPAGSQRRAAARRLPVGDRHADRDRQLHRADGEQAPHRAVAAALRRDHAAAARAAAQAHERHRGFHRAQRGAAARHHRRARPPRGGGELQPAAGLGPVVALHLQPRAAQGSRDRAGADRLCRHRRRGVEADAHLRHHHRRSIRFRSITRRSKPRSSIGSCRHRRCTTPIPSRPPISARARRWRCSPSSRHIDRTAHHGHRGFRRSVGSGMHAHHAGPPTAIHDRTHSDRARALARLRRALPRRHHDRPRYDDRERRPADDQIQPRFQRDQPGLGGQCLSPDVRRLHAARRPARRPLRPAACCS